MRALDIRPDLPRRPQRGLERPKPKYPPIWRGSTGHDDIQGPDARGFYRMTHMAENRCCILEASGPTRICVMGDFGFLVEVDYTGDLR